MFDLKQDHSERCTKWDNRDQVVAIILSALFGINTLVVIHAAVSVRMAVGGACGNMKSSMPNLFAERSENHRTQTVCSIFYIERYNGNEM